MGTYNTMELKTAAESAPQTEPVSEQMGHNFSGGFSLFSLRDKDAGLTPANIKFFDYSGSYSYDPMSAPAVAGDASDSAHGVGAGSTTVVVSNTGGQPADQSGNVWGNDSVGLTGIDGVASNVFAKEEVVKVDADPTLRRDLCCESYSCMFCCTGGHAFFFKIPDCLGGGCRVMSCFGEGAATLKVLQKPTCCEVICSQVCLDASTCCSNKGENDLTCCTACKYQRQCTYCCICQEASKCQCGLMRTIGNCWLWLLCCDYRCSVPPMSFAPLQCTICGFGYRCYENGGCGCRIRADTCADQAPAAAGGSTTVVVVNQSS